MDENKTIKNLILKHCRLTGANLVLLCGSLSKAKNEHLVKLDISENPIVD